jgi:hypothetical protein
MGELGPAAGAHPEDARHLCRRQRIQVQVGGGRPGHRGHPGQHVPGGPGQPLQAQQGQVAMVAGNGQRLARRRHAETLYLAADLQGVERVAARGPVDPHQHRPDERRAERAGEHLMDRGNAERPDLDAGDRLPVQ